MSEAPELLRYIDQAADLAREAFASGDMVTGIAAISLASQLVQLANALAKTSRPAEDIP